MRLLAQLLMVLSIVLQGMMPAMAMQRVDPVAHHHAGLSSHHQGHDAEKSEPTDAKTSGQCPTCKPMHAMTCCSASLCGTCLSTMPVVSEGQTNILPLHYPLARVAQMLARAPDPLVPPPRA